MYGLIAFAVAAIGLGVVAFFSYGTLGGCKVKHAQTEAAQIANFIESYYAFQEEFPESLDDLVAPPGGMAPITRELPLDPWGSPYVYAREGTDEYELYSAGPDRLLGTDDDRYAPGTGPPRP